MIGFELSFNNDKVSAALDSGVVSIILTKISTEYLNEIELDFTGLNTKENGENESLDWFKSSLKVGDELTIKVKDIIQNSTPNQVRIKDSVSEEQRKLESYLSLKKELKKTGLI